MTSSELDRLVAVGSLSREPAAEGEVAGLLHSGEARLADAAIQTLALESRFDLAYNAAHSLTLAGLRRLGYRPRNPHAVHSRGHLARSGKSPRSSQPDGVRGFDGAGRATAGGHDRCGPSRGRRSEDMINEPTPSVHTRGCAAVASATRADPNPAPQQRVVRPLRQQHDDRALRGTDRARRAGPGGTLHALRRSCRPSDRGEWIETPSALRRRDRACRSACPSPSRAVGFPAWSPARASAP
jgi:hypothetical protein